MEGVLGDQLGATMAFITAAMIFPGMMASFCLRGARQQVPHLLRG